LGTRSLRRPARVHPALWSLPADRRVDDARPLRRRRRNALAEGQPLALAVDGQVADEARELPARQALEALAETLQIAREQLPGDLNVRVDKDEGRRRRRRFPREHHRAAA